MCRVYGQRVRICKARGGPRMVPAVGVIWNKRHDHVLQATGMYRVKKLEARERD